MKLSKAGLPNDLSVYRRLLDSNTTAGKAAQSHTGLLAPFLAQRFQSLEQLKDSLEMKSAVHVTRFFTALLNYCVVTYRGEFILRHQQYSLVFGIVSAFFLCGFGAFQAEREIVGQCYQILSQNPFVPLICEGNFLPGSVLRKLPGFAPPLRAPIICDSGALRAIADQYMLSRKIVRFRELFKRGMNQIAAVRHAESIDMQSLCQILLSLSEMASAIIEQFAFKCICPAALGEGVGLYDSQVKHNHSSAELDVLIEVIGQMKTIAAFALQVESIVTPFIDKFVATFIQNFVQVQLDATLEAAHKKPHAVNVIVQIRSIFGYWATNNLPERKLRRNDGCTTPPSLHQLAVLRLAVQSLYTVGGICTDPKTGKLY
jgi:hypothetical protein